MILQVGAQFLWNGSKPRASGDDPKFKNTLGFAGK